MEGSTLGRENWKYKTEVDVEKGIEEVLKKSKNITFFSASSQNIDRLVSAYKACIKTGTIFVIDLYTAYILHKLGNVSKGIPQYSWNNIRIKYFKYHGDCLVRSGLIDFLYKCKVKKIEMTEINNNRDKFLMLLRDNAIFNPVVNSLDNTKDSVLIYSMWEGYLKEEFAKKCKAADIKLVQIHTSGHATPKDLKAFAKALNPKTLIPIHTFFPGKYRKMFGRAVKTLKDGEEYKV